MEQHSFGYWLRLKRKALDLTREGLADRVGCSAATIRKIEADERTAFLRFARGDWTNTPGETTALAPWRAATISTRSNLPAVTTSLVGREIEIARVREYLLRKDIRLLTLIGPPGIGKTRLGLETARQTLDDFPGGVFFVALAPIEDPSLIAPVMVRALGYVEAKDLPAEKILVDGIGGKQMLIVLDNCEHLIENIAHPRRMALHCPRA
jgi:DNA-binding XRE family transcriptional regulator